MFSREFVAGADDLVGEYLRILEAREVSYMS
jgi:hypothetical protein